MNPTNFNNFVNISANLFQKHNAVHFKPYAQYIKISIKNYKTNCLKFLQNSIAIK